MKNIEKKTMHILTKTDVEVISMKEYQIPESNHIVRFACVKGLSSNPNKPFSLVCNIPDSNIRTQIWVSVGHPGGAKAEILLPDDEIPTELLNEAKTIL